MKYLGEKTMPDPRTGTPGPFDLFEFKCRWCDIRGILGAPILHKEWPFACPGCARKYTHWRPTDGAGVPDLVPMVDLYERTQVDPKTGKLTGRPQPVPPPPVPRLHTHGQATHPAPSLLEFPLCGRGSSMSLDDRGK